MFYYVGVPAQTTKQTIEADWLMIEGYEMQFIQMTENIWRNLAKLIRQFCKQGVFRNIESLFVLSIFFLAFDDHYGARGVME